MTFRPVLVPLVHPLDGNQSMFGVDKVKEGRWLVSGPLLAGSALGKPSRRFGMSLGCVNGRGPCLGISCDLLVLIQSLLQPASERKTWKLKFCFRSQLKSLRLEDRLSCSQTTELLAAKCWICKSQQLTALTSFLT